MSFPNCQGIVAVTGQVTFRLHDSGRYLFPIGKKGIKPAHFNCPNCREPVRWLETKGGSAVFSCRCFVAVCGRPNGTVLVTEDLWFQWIADAWVTLQQEQRRQAN